MVNNLSSKHSKLVVDFLLETIGIETDDFYWLSKEVSDFYSDSIKELGIIEQITELFPLAIILIDCNYNIIFANSAYKKHFCSDKSELKNKNYLQTIFDNKKYDHQGRYCSPVLYSLDTERELRRQYARIKLSLRQEPYRYEISTKLIRDDNLEVKGVCGVFFGLDVHNDINKTIVDFNSSLFSHNPNLFFLINEKIDTLIPQYGQHFSHVVENSELLGKAYGLNEQDLDLLKKAATLHEFGKIAIPSEVLQKEKDFTKEELDMLMKHSETAYHLFKNVTGYEKVALIIRHQYERYDGKGEPFGLKGEQIPLESRMIGLVDHFEHMLSENLYLKNLSIKEVLHKIKNQSGKNFDPKLVSLWESIISDKRLKIEKHQELKKTQNRSLLYESYSICRILEKVIAEEIGNHAKISGITFPQYHVLTILRLQNDLMISEIARLGYWSIAGVMSLVDGLKKKGLVKTEPVEKGRGSKVLITARGEGIVVNQMENMMSNLDEVFEDTELENIQNIVSFIQHNVLNKFLDQEVIEDIEEHFFLAKRKFELDNRNIH